MFLESYAIRTEFSIIIKQEGKSIRLGKLIKLTKPLPKSFRTGSKKLLAENSSDTAFLMSLGHILVNLTGSPY